MKVKSLSLALSSLVALSNAATWNFNVVNIMGEGYDIGLKYNNNVVPMTTDSEKFPLYTASINSGSGNKYKYVLLDKSGSVVEEESKERTFDSSSTSTTNEVYNRFNSQIGNISKLPNTYESLFRSGTDKYSNYPINEIYNVYAKCDEEAYQYLKYNPLVNGSKNEASANCTINVITPTENFQRTGQIQLVGYNSRLYKKLSWKIKLDKKLFGRKTLKIRALASDPTLLRDKLSAEMHRALGIPVQSGVYSRFMVNNDIWGLYSLVDTIGGKWIASAIHGNDDAHVGSSYKMYSSVPNGPYASLRYLGDKASAYANSGSYEADEIDKEDTEATHEFYRLAKFTKLFEEWSEKYENDQSEEAVEALNSFFNIESLLRQMVIETLTVAYDSFWAQLGNYGIYYNPEQKKYQVLPFDFDGTFYGSNGSPYYASDYLTDCITWTKNTLPDKYFVNNIMNNSRIKARFNTIMSEFLEKTFNVDAAAPFIDSIANLIEEDVEWNFGLIDKLDSKIPGYVNHFTLQNFLDNTNYKKVGYNEAINVNDAHYGIKQWIKMRGGNCQSYVDTVAYDSEGPFQAGSVSSSDNTNIPSDTTIVSTTSQETTEAKTTTTTSKLATTAAATTTTTTKKSTSTKLPTTTTRVRVTKVVTVKKIVTVTKYVVKNKI